MAKKDKKQWKDLKLKEKIIGVGAIAFIGLAIIMGATGAFDETDEEKAEREARQEQREQKKAEKKEEKQESESEEKEVSASKEESEQEDVTWDDVKDKDKIDGKSNKDFLEITKSKPSDVRNDVTDSWKVVTASKGADMAEYALSYHDLYMEEGEVHFIVNFGNNTTTWLNHMGGLLYVDIRERVDKEEHNADKLGTGMVLKSYRIYPGGDIEELEMEY